MSTQTIILNPGDTLTVIAPPNVPPQITSVSISGPATVKENATAQFSAQVNGIGNYDKTVTWSCSDGTITQSGLFTAPGKIEQVVITATANGDNSKKALASISIANSGNTVTLNPSGGDDTAALQSALNKLVPGQILQMLLGTWNLSPIFIPGRPLLITPNALLLDRIGYGKDDCMFTTSDGSQVTGTGAFLQMPHSFLASENDGSEWRHAFRITGKNPIVTGISVTQAGGDGFYGIDVINGMLQNVSAQDCFRNGCSLTDNVNGFLVSMGIFGKQAGGDKVIQCGLDVEPNLINNLPNAKPCIVTIQNCQFLDNAQFPISNGLRLSLNNLTVNNPAVKVIVSNNVARNNKVDYKSEWPTSAGKPSGWIVTGSGNADTNGPTNYPN